MCKVSRSVRLKVVGGLLCLFGMLDVAAANGGAPQPARFVTWTLLPDVNQFQVSGTAQAGALVTLYNNGSKCRGYERGHGTADAQGRFRIVLTNIPESRGFDSKVRLSGKERCDTVDGFFDKVEPYPPIPPLPDAPEILGSTPISGLHAARPQLNGRVSSAGTVQLYRDSRCENQPVATFVVEQPGEWYQEVDAPEGTSQFFARLAITGRVSQCSFAYDYTNDPTARVIVSIASVERNYRDFHTLTVGGSATLHTSVTAFAGRNCDGTELGSVAMGELTDNFSMEIDVPDDMGQIEFSLLGYRDITQERVCEVYTDYSGLALLDVVALTVSTYNYPELTVTVSPKQYPYVTTTLYRDVDCHANIQTSDDPEWTITFPANNATGLSVFAVDQTGRAVCQSFPGAIF